MSTQSLVLADAQLAHFEPKSAPNPMTNLSFCAIRHTSPILAIACG
jgi:hypothetical protein